jgi:hypothetical protein
MTTTTQQSERLGPYARLGSHSRLLDLEAIRADSRYDDPRLDSYGPHLFAEVDEQAYATYLLLGVVADDSLWTYSDPGAVSLTTVVRANGFAAKSWSDEDYAEMEQVSAPRPLRDYGLPERPASRAEERRVSGTPAPAEMYAAAPADPFASLPRGTRRVPEEAEVCYYNTPEGLDSGEPCQHAEFLGCEGCPAYTGPREPSAPEVVRASCASCGLPEEACDCSPLSCAACGAGAFFCDCGDGLPEVVPPPVAKVFPDLLPSFWRDSATKALLDHRVDAARQTADLAGESLDALDEWKERTTDAVTDAITGLFAPVVEAADRLSEQLPALRERAEAVRDRTEALAALLADEPSIHRFDNTGDAYDETQYRDDIRDGDVLVVESEGVVGILYEAWPTAVTSEAGHFHRLKDGATWEELEGGRYQASLRLALRFMRETDRDASEPEPMPPAEHHEPCDPAEAARMRAELDRLLDEGGLPPQWRDAATDAVFSYQLSTDWLGYAEMLLQDLEDMDGYSGWESHHDPDRPADPEWGEAEDDGEDPVELAQHFLTSLADALEQNGEAGWEDEAQALTELYEPTAEWAAMAESHLAAWKPDGPPVDSPADPLVPNFADTVSDNDGYIAPPDDERERFAVSNEPSPPAPPPPTGGDGEPEAPSPSDPVPGEPPARGKDDDGTPDSAPDGNAGNEAAAQEAGPHAEEQADGEAETVGDAVRQPTYRSVPAEQREEVIAEGGLKVRVQLTSYEGGRYLKGAADNYMVGGRTAPEVREALEPLLDMAKARFGKSKGGRRLRVQLTEQSAKGSAYLKQDGDAPTSYNLSVPGITAVDGSPLVDYLLAVAFGERRREAAMLAVAWRRFESLPLVENEGGSPKPEGGSPQEEAPTTTSGAPQNSPNAVQPSGRLKTGVGQGPYTFDADGCAPCHLPSLVTPLDSEPRTPESDAAREWALDFVNEPDFACNGEKDHMLRLARKWKARFPDHEVVVREGGCQDSPYRPDADQLGKPVALVGVSVSEAAAAPAQAGNPANPETAPATKTENAGNTVQPSGIPEGYDPDRDAVESMVESLRVLGHGKLADLLINAGGTPKRNLYRQAYDLVAGEEVTR